MSTHIKNIKGRVEITKGSQKITYENTEISVVRFAGGIKEGTMIQLTIMNGSSYVQFTKKQAKKLVKAINKAFK